MSPLGELTSHFDLPRTVFYGPNDPVSGKVILRFKSLGPKELFAPLRLKVTLQGWMQLHVAENRTSHAYIFINERRKLCTTTEVFNGSIRAMLGEPQGFPFEIHFPPCTESWPNETLPPSFHARIEVTAPRQYGRHQGEATVEYSLHAQAETPGIDSVNQNSTHVITYQHRRPLPEFDLGLDSGEFSQTMTAQTYNLLPESERPSSLLARTAATLKSVTKPTYAFTASCSGVPTALALGQKLCFAVRIRNDAANTTATVVPDITVKSKVDIIAQTTVWATDKNRGDSPRLVSTKPALSLTMVKQEPSGPFRKQDDYTKTLTFDIVPESLPCSFTTLKLTRSYRLYIELTFDVAGQSLSMEKEFKFQIIPPPLFGPPPEDARVVADQAEAGPSYRAPEETLPAYNEVWNGE
jgi:hypothetical protein